MGLVAFRRVQTGVEVTPGTAVAATAKWMNQIVTHDLGGVEITQPGDERGSLAGAFRAYVLKKLWTARLSGDATFEDLIIPLSMAVKGGVTPTTPGGTTPRLWTFAPNLTSGNTPDTRTLEFGDDTQEYESAYVFLTSLEIGGALDDTWKIAGDLVGRAPTASTFTAALADRTVENILTPKTKLYIDDSGGTIGTTQKAATLLDWTWRMRNHFTVKRHQDGSLDFTAFGEQRLMIELELVLELTSDIVTLRTKYATDTGGTRQLVRIEGTGSNIEPTYDRRVRIDGAYRILGFGPLGDRNSANTVTVRLGGEYDPTWAKLFEITVQNAVATMPG